MRREALKFWDLVRLILETLRYYIIENTTGSKLYWCRNVSAYIYISKIELIYSKKSRNDIVTQAQCNVWYDLYNVYTVEYRYSAVQHNMILHMVQQWLRQNMLQRLYSQKTPHTSPSRASYGVSFVSNGVTIDRIITASHCMCFFSFSIQLQLCQCSCSFSQNDLCYPCCFGK